ncbi:hypothetical protein C0995_012153 [Termitomyces sp. Mi166|nr:hypothetical protein C0995_012153 [Termitomyces sp. Mi166\
MHDHEMKEYFEGFLRKHISMYSRIKQLSLAEEPKQARDILNAIEAMQQLSDTLLSPVEPQMKDPHPGLACVCAHPYRSVSAFMLHGRSTPTTLSSMSAAANHICCCHINAASTASGSDIHDASSISVTALSSSTLGEWAGETQALAAERETGAALETHDASLLAKDLMGIAKLAKQTSLL